MKDFQSIATRLNMDQIDNYNGMIFRNDIRFEDLIVSNDDSLKLLHKEISNQLEIASTNIYGNRQ